MGGGVSRILYCRGERRNKTAEFRRLRLAETPINQETVMGTWVMKAAGEVVVVVVVMCNGN